MSADLLPSSVPRVSRGVVVQDGTSYVPCFCASCCKRGPNVINGDRYFAFYLCEPCAETHGTIAGTMMIPDEVHWEMQRQEQLEHYGRQLSLIELAEVEKDGNHTLTKLARDYAPR